jgi:hypothetical protein
MIERRTTRTWNILALNDIFNSKYEVAACIHTFVQPCHLVHDPGPWRQLVCCTIKRHHCRAFHCFLLDPHSQWGRASRGLLPLDCFVAATARSSPVSPLNACALLFCGCSSKSDLIEGWCSVERAKMMCELPVYCTVLSCPWHTD